jgi:hypothetical protein
VQVHLRRKQVDVCSAAAAALCSTVEHARASSMCASVPHTVSTTGVPETPLPEMPLDMGEITVKLPSAAAATPAAAHLPPPTPSISPFVEEKRPSGLRIVRPVSAVAQQAVSAALNRHLSSSDMTSRVASPYKGAPQHRCHIVEQMPSTPSTTMILPPPLVSWRTMPVAGAALRQTETQSAASLLMGETSSATEQLGSRKGLYHQEEGVMPHESSEPTSSDSDFELPMPAPTSSAQGIVARASTAQEMAPAHAGEEDKASDSPLGSAGKVYDNVIYSPNRSRRSDRSRARTPLDGGSCDDEGSEEEEKQLAPVIRARDSPQLSQKRASSAPLKRSKIAFTPVSATHADQQAATDEPLTPRWTMQRPSSTGDSGESPSTSALAQVAGARHCPSNRSLPMIQNAIPSES